MRAFDDILEFLCVIWAIIFDAISYVAIILFGLLMMALVMFIVCYLLDVTGVANIIRW